jgi:alkylhydroperoxidase family enzyme
MGLGEDKLAAVADPDNPMYTPRERAGLEMAGLFTEDYRAITDAHLARWKAHFSEEELVELGAFMALADGFGKLVEMLGLGQAEQTSRHEV